jgi:tetraacyldisaccharide 4'-kinase
MSIEPFIIDLIEGKRKHFLMEKLLAFSSFFYKKAVEVRHFLYDFRLARSHSVSLPVISIGNIVAGGTGKTPFVQKLVEELSMDPGSVAILSRGYRSLAEHQFVLASSGYGPLVSPSICGDEAYWLASSTNASVWVGKNRLWSARHLNLSKAKIAILEDGFQHRKIQRNVEIVLLDATDLFGRNHFLPRGYLRDLPSRLSKADYVVVTRLKPDFVSEEIERKIRAFTKAPIVGFQASYSLDVNSKGKKVGAFCGIAKPDFFYEALEGQGVEIVDRFSVADHKVPSLEQLSCFSEACKKLGAEMLICTEKDYVKLFDYPSLSLPIRVLKMQLECIWNQPVWKQMIETIKNRL